MIWGRLWRWMIEEPPLPGEAAPQPAQDADRLGIAAERLIADPVLSMAFDLVKRKLTTTWQASAATDQAGRENVYLQLRALDLARSELMAMVGNRKVLAAEQKRREAERQAAA